MGGSASNDSQLFELLARYGGGQEAPPAHNRVRFLHGLGGNMNFAPTGSGGQAGFRPDGSSGRKPPQGNGGGGGNGGAGAGKPQYWKFPQYTQTWAFTPPKPSPYAAPPKFDPAKYGDPGSKKNR